jgi:hypothetical protein
MHKCRFYENICPHAIKYTLFVTLIYYIVEGHINLKIQDDRRFKGKNRIIVINTRAMVLASNPVFGVKEFLKMINCIVERLIDSKIRDDCKTGKKRKNRIDLFINCILKYEKKNT